MIDEPASVSRSRSGAGHARPESITVIEAGPRKEPDNPWITFALVGVGTFMIMLDASIVNISLPSIARTFHTPVGGAIEWVIIAYLITIAATLLTFGRLSDMVGRKPLWLAGLALFTLGFILPFYFEELRGFSTARSGLFLTALPLTLALVAPLSGSLADRFGSRWLASGGLAVACLGLAAVARLNAQSSDRSIIWPLVLTGVGQGLFMTPNARALMNAAPASEQGESSGLLATGRVLGQSLSVALAGAIFAGLGGAEAGRRLIEARTDLTIVGGEISAAQQQFLAGFHTALLVCAGIAAAGVFAALTRGPETEPVVRPVPGTRANKQIQNAKTAL